MTPTPGDARVVYDNGLTSLRRTYAHSGNHYVAAQMPRRKCLNGPHSLSELDIDELCSIGAYRRGATQTSRRFICYDMFDEERTL